MSNLSDAARDANEALLPRRIISCLRHIGHHDARYGGCSNDTLEGHHHYAR